jgi:hypothetical protein
MRKMIFYFEYIKIKSFEITYLTSLEKKNMSFCFHRCKIGEKDYKCYERFRNEEDGIYYMYINRIYNIESSYLDQFSFGGKEYNFYYPTFNIEEKIKINEDIIKDFETIQEGDFNHHPDYMFLTFQSLSKFEYIQVSSRKIKGAVKR